MPSGVDNSLSRKVKKQSRTIPGPRRLHRGIHINQNTRAVSQYANRDPAKPTSANFKALLVHHQKINEELKDVYARTAALHKENMTLDERIEESWKAFERIGGKRPTKPTGFAQHLAQVSEKKKTERAMAVEERTTAGETTDFSRGSALHDQKDRRVQQFVRKQLQRAHMLRRYGDPTPMKQSGKFDRRTGELKVFHKTIRQVRRATAQDNRTREVKSHRGGRTQWDTRRDDTNVNRPASKILRDSSSEFDIGARPQKRRRK